MYQRATVVVRAFYRLNLDPFSRTVSIKQGDFSTVPNREQVLGAIEGQSKNLLGHSSQKWAHCHRKFSLDQIETYQKSWVEVLVSSLHLWDQSIRHKVPHSMHQLKRWISNTIKQKVQ